MTNSLEDVEIISIELTQPEDRKLPAYDYTTLTAMNTCPAWGSIRYLNSKMFEGSSRATPLEMGAACHAAFAAIRLYQLAFVQGKMEHANFHGSAIFGGHWPGIFDFMSDTSESELQRQRNGMMAAFHSTGFVDSQYDKRRTIDNAEAALYVYLDQWDWTTPVWVQDNDKPASPIGVELLVDFVITARVTPEYTAAFRVPTVARQGDCVRIRYIGRVDGLHHHGERLRVHENKTSGRLDDAWEEGFTISHQITGYSIAASLYADEHVEAADVIGLQIPLPRDSFRAIRRAFVTREKHNYLNWMRWLFHSLEKVWLYKDAPLEAPQYSHSCNRYFRPCAFIPLCYATDADRAEFYSQMIDDPWTPLRDYEAKVGE